MSLEQNLESILSSLILQAPPTLSPNDSFAGLSVESSDLIACIDLTLLDEQASAADAKQIFERAISYKTACACLYLKNIEQLGSDAKRFNLATVVNFPNGTNSLDSSLLEIKQAQTLGVQEIDFVFPYSWYIQGEKNKALELTQTIAKTCKQANFKFKIIMETGAFSSMEVLYQLSLELIALGCDFLKTSTGKIAKGASLSAAFALLSAIRDSGNNCGIKLSGGIREKEQAFAYAQLAQLVLEKKINPSWFRIGASGLLQNLESHPSTSTIHSTY